MTRAVLGAVLCLMLVGAGCGSSSSSGERPAGRVDLRIETVDLQGRRDRTHVRCPGGAGNVCDRLRSLDDQALRAALTMPTLQTRDLRPIAEAFGLRELRVSGRARDMQVSLRYGRSGSGSVARHLEELVELLEVPAR